MCSGLGKGPLNAAQEERIAGASDTVRRTAGEVCRDFLGVAFWRGRCGILCACGVSPWLADGVFAVVLRSNTAVAGRHKESE